jgi:tetratricopeptide (TPR) repeat protein
MKKVLTSVYFILFFSVVGSIAQTDPIKPTGGYYALIIGESLYDNPKLTLDRPAKDAAKFKDIILANYTFDEKNVKLLQNANRQQIIAELYNLRKIITSNDNLVIFYAGHGYWDDQSQQGYWWPRDASIEEPSNWLSNSDLKEQIRGIKSAHTLLISDACFSGGIFKTRGAAELIRNSSLNIQMQYKMPSRRAMTSGTLTTVPDESVFFTYLVKRLVENKEKFLPSEDLFSSLKQAVINNSMVVPQDGVIAEAGDEGGDFIFIHKSNPISPHAAINGANPAATITRGGTNLSVEELLEKGKDDFNNKKLDDAYNAFNKVVSLDSQNYDGYVSRGRASLRLHKLELAIRDFSTAIALKPNLAWSYCLRGMAKMEEWKLQDAIADLNKAIEINPRYTLAYNFRGFAHEESGKNDFALNDFTEAIRLDAKFVLAYDNRGFLKIRLEKFDDAIADFSKAIEIAPNFALAYSDRGLAKFRQGKTEDAMIDVTKSMDLDARSPRAYNTRGQIYAKSGKLDLAIADFSKAAELNPRYLEARLNRAKIYYQNKDFTNAEDDIDKILLIWPKNQEAQELKMKIRAAKP